MNACQVAAKSIAAIATNTHLAAIAMITYILPLLPWILLVDSFCYCQ
jgi:hypothetical protein